MNIAIFTNNYLPNPYGVTGSIESFRNVFEKQGHTVYVFSPFWKGYHDKNPHVFRYPSVDIKIKFRFPLPIPYSRAVSRIIKELDLDIIHSHHPNLLGAAAKKWAGRKNIPLVFTWHTLYDLYTNFVPFLSSSVAARWMIHGAARYANRSGAVIAPTRSTAERMREWGVKKKIKVIPTGVSETQFVNPDRKKIRSHYAVRDSEILLVLLSRLTEEKNVEFLLRALIPVIKKYSHIKLLLGGEGYLLETLKSISENNCVKDRVIFSGLVPKDEVKDYLAAGDIFVHASKSETQGMILSEAMYTGLPIVAVDATGAKDLIAHKVSGLLTGDSMKEFSAMVELLINNPLMRETLGDNAKEIARKKYASEICAKEMMRVYEEAIAEKKTGIKKASVIYKESLEPGSELEM